LRSEFLLDDSPHAQMKASALYRSELWRAGLAAARVLPRPVLTGLATFLAASYHAANKTRRDVVIRNLLPVLAFDRPIAERACRKLFRHFGVKLADLWRYEAGHEIAEVATSPEQSARFEAARSRGRGVLLLTPHIGNWEFGAPFLRKRGVALQVITQAEPQDALTGLRKASRARWGIETLVIGENPFAFVEVIRRLESGATVALLVDRPAAANSVIVKLFGHRFPASLAPAELARATGCALLPVCIPHASGGYSVEVFPEIAYDRAALGTREARANLTQEIMKQFEPAIRSHLDQWYHFVPVWSTEEL
jgi:lauroyl/myristoyl acyltransferase